MREPIVFAFAEIHAGLEKLEAEKRGEMPRPGPVGVAHAVTVNAKGDALEMAAKIKADVARAIKGSLCIVPRGALGPAVSRDGSLPADALPDTWASWPNPMASGVDDGEMDALLGALRAWVAPKPSPARVHSLDCGWQLDQYNAECDCGAAHSPPFVVWGGWRDPEPPPPWRGQRMHPFGVEAFCVVVDGETLVFPSEEAAEAHPEAAAVLAGRVP